MSSDPPSTPAALTARQRVQQAFDPELFGRVGTLFSSLLADYLRRAQRVPSPALPWQPPEVHVARARDIMQGAPTTDHACPSHEEISKNFAELAETFLASANRLHSPHYMGHQVPASIPLAGLLDCLGSTTNQVMAIYEMGPFATGIEKAVVDTLAEYIGWPAGTYAGVGTHGASLANMTALLTARNVKLAGSWEQGLAVPTGSDSARPAIVTGVDSHYSVSRAAGIVGIGTDQVLKAPLDDQRRFSPDRLPAFLDDARARGYHVFAVVASACSTPIGAFDPLDKLAAIAHDRDLWFHVDGAHGASVLLSRRHRHLVQGIEQADSLSWDAHKMLFMPGLCTLLFYRDAAHSYETFRQDAPYLFDPHAPGLAAYDSAVRTVECTKRAMMTGLWGLWSVFGPQLFEDMIDLTFELGQQFAELLRAADDFELLHQPACNIVCFRHLPGQLQGADAEQISNFQLALRRRMVESGDFYLTSTHLAGSAALRVTLINPLTERTHLAGLLTGLRELARDL